MGGFYGRKSSAPFWLAPSVHLFNFLGNQTHEPENGIASNLKFCQKQTSESLRLLLLFDKLKESFIFWYQRHAVIGTKG